MSANNSYFEGAITKQICFLQLVSLGSLPKHDMINEAILGSACFLSGEEAVQEARDLAAIHLVLPA